MMLNFRPMKFILASCALAMVPAAVAASNTTARTLPHSVRLAFQGDNPHDTVHTPAPGSAERKEIMDALRGDQDVVFKVHYLKVHNGWAWTDTTPLDKAGKPVAEGGTNLLHRAGGVWRVMDLSVIPEDPDEPMESQDVTPKFVQKCVKQFPGLPADIFPKHDK